LLLAVINQAISDVLENEGEAEAAEQWLSSRDFDSFVEPLACGPEVFRHRLAHPSPVPERKPTGKHLFKRINETVGFVLVAN
jgi:hypothetical protein